MSSHDRILEIAKKLAPEEAEELLNEIEAHTMQTVEGFVARKESKRIEALTAEYYQKMIDPSIRGKGHLLRQIKENYRALGVPVDRVDFTGV